MLSTKRASRGPSLSARLNSSRSLRAVAATLLVAGAGLAGAGSAAAATPSLDPKLGAPPSCSVTAEPVVNVGTVDVGSSAIVGFANDTGVLATIDDGDCAAAIVYLTNSSAADVYVYPSDVNVAGTAGLVGGATNPVSGVAYEPTHQIHVEAGRGFGGTTGVPVLLWFGNPTAASLAAAFDWTLAATIPSIPYGASGTLHVTKYGGHLAGDPHDGQQITPQPSGQTIEDVEFSYILLPQDLHTSAGWAAAMALSAGSTDPWAQLNAAFLPVVTTYDADHPPVATGTMVTGPGGVATKTLPAGLYFFWESDAPPHTNILTPATPFVIAVPMSPNPTPDDYDIWVYPKNDTPTFHKEVIDGNDDGSGDFVGDDVITYQLTADVPVLSPGQTFTQFDISDPLDVRLDLVAGSPTLTFGGTDAGAFAGWVPGTDYEFQVVANPGTNPLFPVADYPVILKLVLLDTAGEDRLDVLSAQRNSSSGTLSFIVTFQVKANTQGEIENTAVYNLDGLFIYDKSDKDVKYGGVSLWKYGTDLTTKTPAELAVPGALTGAALAGAEFQIFKAATWTAGTCTPTGPALSFFDLTDSKGVALGTFDGQSGNPNDTAYYVTPVTTGVSDSTGHVILGGLAFGKYCVQETKAPTSPSAYKAVTTYIPVEIQEPLDGIYFGAGVVDDYLVANTPVNAGFPFPLTGGTGVMIFAIVAGVVVGATLFVIRRQRKEMTA